MTGPVRQILVDGMPTAGRMDDTHVWGAGGLLSGAARDAQDGAARYAAAEAEAAIRRDVAAEGLAARIFGDEETGGDS